MVVIAMVSSELRQATYSNTGLCSTDTPYVVVQKSSKIKCALECLHLETCQDQNFNENTNECALFLHKPLFYESIPVCAGFKERMIIISTILFYKSSSADEIHERDVTYHLIWLLIYH